MSLETYIDGIKANVDRYLEEDLSILWAGDPNVQKWNNLEPSEVQEMVEETFDLLNIALKKNLLPEGNFSNLNAINSNLNNFNSQYQQVKGLLPNQLRNQHHSPLNQLNGVNSNLRNSGIYSLIKLSPDIAENDKLIQEQLININERKTEIDKLTTQVRTLLSPAVADRLSNAFSKRKEHIFYQKIGWLVLLVLAIVFAYLATNSVTNDISKLMNPEEGEIVADGATIGIIWILRLLILFPIYFVVFFALKQYAKERKFEEVYAHKSAISETLPSYPELLTQKEVGDQLTSEAASVIFSPAETENLGKTSKKNYKLNDIKELIEIVTRVSKGAN